MIWGRRVGCRAWGVVRYVIGPKLRWQYLWAERQLAVLSCRMGFGGESGQIGAAAVRCV